MPDKRRDRKKGSSSSKRKRNPVSKQLPAWRSGPGSGVPDFPSAFQPGQGAYVGHVDLPSGRVAVADAVAFSPVSPLPPSFPPGSYPVFLSRVEIDGQRENAAALLLLSRDQPVRWERGPTVQVVLALGCFMDPATEQALIDREEQYEQVCEQASDMTSPSFVYAPVPDRNVVGFEWWDSEEPEPDYQTYLAYGTSGLIAVVVGFGKLPSDQIRPSEAYRGDRNARVESLLLRCSPIVAECPHPLHER